MRLLTFACILGYATVSSAHQFLKRNKNERLSATISPKHYNRFSFEGDEIEQVFANGDVLIEEDEKNGQIFLKLSDPASKKVYVTFVTERGVTQDMELKASSKEPQSIVLTPDHPSKNSVKTDFEDLYVMDIKALSKTMMEGIKPKVFQVDETITLSNPLPELELVRSTLYRSSRISGAVYVFKNQTDHEKPLLPDNFKRPNTQAIVMTGSSILPGDEAMVVVLYRENKEDHELN